MRNIIVIVYWVNVLNLAYADPPAVCPTIITREQWEARDPGFVDYTVFPLDYVIIHHTATNPCNTTSSCSNTVAGIQSYHIDELDFGDIGYNFLVGGDGNVYEGLGWHKQGAHTLGYNKNSIGLGFIGNFMKIAPPGKQIQAAKDLLQCGIELGELTENYKLYGARQVGQTESPGLKLFDKIRNWRHFSRPAT